MGDLGGLSFPPLRTLTRVICYQDAKMMVLGLSPKLLLVELLSCSLPPHMLCQLLVSMKVLLLLAVVARTLHSPILELSMIPMLRRELTSSVLSQSNIVPSLVLSLRMEMFATFCVTKSLL